MQIVHHNLSPSRPFMGMPPACWGVEGVGVEVEAVRLVEEVLADLRQLLWYTCWQKKMMMPDSGFVLVIAALHVAHFTMSST